MEADFQRQFRSGIATYQGPGFGTRRPAWPRFPWFRSFSITDGSTHTIHPTFRLQYSRLCDWLTASEATPIDGNSSLGMKIPIQAISLRDITLVLLGCQDSLDQHTQPKILPPKPESIPKSVTLNW